MLIYKVPFQQRIQKIHHLTKQIMRLIRRTPTVAVYKKTYIRQSAYK